jgi:heme-degrading monooxygenase HmoA
VYATIRSYSAGEEFVDALVARQSEVRSVISPIAGFRAYYLLRSTEGEAVSISVFDDEAGAEESTRAAAAWVADNLPDLHVSPPQVTAGEVAFGF